jgi:hypothetical protein
MMWVVIDIRKEFLKQDPLSALKSRNGAQTIKSQIDYLYFLGKYAECLHICELVADGSHQKKGNKTNLTDYSIRETMARCNMVCSHLIWKLMTLET